jgi:hypothetical protein
MTSYVANFQKKIRIRGEKEEALRRFIAQGKDETKLLKAAETVRDARIRELQAKKAQISPRDTPERIVRISNLDRRIEALRATSPESILSEFGVEHRPPSG